MSRRVELSSTSQIELADMTKAPQAELLTDKELFDVIICLNM